VCGGVRGQLSRHRSNGIAGSTPHLHTNTFDAKLELSRHRYAQIIYKSVQFSTRVYLRPDTACDESNPARMLEGEGPRHVPSDSILHDFGLIVMR